MSDVPTKLKVGEVILVKKSNNGNKRLEGKLCAINAINSNGYSVKPVDSSTGTHSVFWSGPSDEFCQADRKEQAKYVAEQIVEAQAHITELEAEHDHLLNYESEEDFVASKLAKILEAPDKESIKKVLSQLKRSDYL